MQKEGDQGWPQSLPDHFHEWYSDDHTVFGSIYYCNFVFCMNSRYCPGVYPVFLRKSWLKYRESV